MANSVLVYYSLDVGVVGIDAPVAELMADLSLPPGPVPP